MDCESANGTRTSFSIPVIASRFIGRKRKISEIENLLASSRLLTLASPVGFSKSRLAIRTVEDQPQRYCESPASNCLKWVKSLTKKGIRKNVKYLEFLVIMVFNPLIRENYAGVPIARNARKGNDMTTSNDLDRVIMQYQLALDDLLRGNPEPALEFFSQRDDVSLANPISPIVCGRKQVEETVRRATSTLRDGKHDNIEPSLRW